MLFYPCLAFMVLTFIYLMGVFALIHYYREALVRPQPEPLSCSLCSLCSDHRTVVLLRKC